MVVFSQGVVGLVEGSVITGQTVRAVTQPQGDQFDAAEPRWCLPDPWRFMTSIWCALGVSLSKLTLHDIWYSVTDLPPKVVNVRRSLVIVIARAECESENGPHYRRDVTLHEDACQLRCGGGRKSWRR